MNPEHIVFSFIHGIFIFSFIPSLWLYRNIFTQFTTDSIYNTKKKKEQKRKKKSQLQYSETCLFMSCVNISLVQINRSGVTGSKSLLTLDSIQPLNFCHIGKRRSWESHCFNLYFSNFSETDHILYVYCPFMYSCIFLILLLAHYSMGGVCIFLLDLQELFIILDINLYLSCNLQNIFSSFSFEFQL